MKVKRIFSFCLVVMLLAGLLTGCGNGQKGGVAPIDDPTVAQADPSILTEELLAKAAENPAVTSEDHPRWTGFTLGYYSKLGEPGATPRAVELCAEWGFNSARVFLPYTTLFNADVTEANLTMLHKLDEMVAEAIEHDIHLNIFFGSLPGRSVEEAWVENDYTSTAELDLFINAEKQTMANRVLSTLAARYKDVPNFNLSITPFQEALNKDLSTGLPYEDFTPDHVAEFLGKAIDAIRAEDPERLIIYEPTAFTHEDAIIEASTPIKAVADTRGNVMISYNFCQTAYVYACMTETAGNHIDNMNSSMFIPEYPNYVYLVPEHICHGQDEDDLAITLDGLLPKGTVLTMQIKSSIGGTLDISADGESLYSEDLTVAEYAISEPLSGYYPYRVSEKSVSAVLPNDAENVVISCKNGAYDICGITLDLPEKYAVEKWYYAQPYDVYQGLEQREGVVKKSTSQVMICPNDFDRGQLITIHDDMTYTTRNPENTSYRTWVENDFYWDMADRNTIDRWSKVISEFDGNCAIRFERADFSGGIWPEMKEYYEDLLQSFEEYGYSWWSNDWWLMVEEYPQTTVIAECPSTKYAGYDHFNLEMLELFQKYQSKE